MGSYTESWCFQTIGGGHSRFIFFGCTVRAVAVDNLRAQVRRIAETVKTEDGPYLDHPQGDFLLEHESHESEPLTHPLVRWKFKNGIFREVPEKDS